MATHLSLLCKATTVLLPTNGRDKNKDGASKSEASGSGSSSGNAAVSGNVLEELNRQRNRNAESIATVEAKIEQVERKTRDLTGECSRCDDNVNNSAWAKAIPGIPGIKIVK
jgi:hypothetical protein